MVSCGNATIKINNHIQTVTSPAVLCISQYDNFQCLEHTHLSAKAFHFDPWYIKACLKFENLEDSIPIDEKYVYDRNMLYMFTKHHGNFQGIFYLTPQQYVHINELMLMIGAETYAQSDDYWTCRIRRMLRQTLNCIFDIYVDQCKFKFYELSENTNPVTTCTDYIHNNYQNDITLSFLCELVHLNRTTLNQRFKQQVNCTCIEYLLHYRLKISQELLSNTNLKIDDIATQCGFKYSSYFNRQFTKCLGITPSEFRKNPTGYSMFEGGKISKL